jgi:hypothetical protein
MRKPALQLPSSIEVVEGDRGFWLKLSLLPWSSQLRRG